MTTAKNGQAGITSTEIFACAGCTGMAGAFRQVGMTLPTKSRACGGVWGSILSRLQKRVLIHSTGFTMKTVVMANSAIDITLIMNERNANLSNGADVSRRRKIFSQHWIVVKNYVNRCRKNLHNPALSRSTTVIAAHVPQMVASKSTTILIILQALVKCFGLEIALALVTTFIRHWDFANGYASDIVMSVNQHTVVTNSIRPTDTRAETGIGLKKHSLIMKREDATLSGGMAAYRHHKIFSMI